MANEIKRGRGLRVLLFASLALNLLFVGLVAGALLRGDDQRKGVRPAGGMEIGVTPVLRALGPEDRKELGRALRNELRGRGEGRQAAQNRLRAFAAVLRQEEVDQAALEGLLAEHSAEMTQRVGVVQAQLAKRLAEKSAEERAMIAARLEDFAENGLPKRGQREDDRKKKDD